MLRNRIESTKVARGGGGEAEQKREGEEQEYERRAEQVREGNVAASVHEVN